MIHRQKYHRKLVQSTFFLGLFFHYGKGINERRSTRISTKIYYKSISKIGISKPERE